MNSSVQNFIRVLVGLLLFVSSVAFAQENEKDDVWKSTSANYQTLNAYLNDANCASSKQKFMGCVDALEVLAAAPETHREVIPATAPLEAGSKLITTIGNVSLVEVAPPTQDKTAAAARILAARQRAKDVDTIWEKTAPVSFSSVATELVKAIPADKQSEVSGNAINAYLSNAIDPHSYLMPVARMAELSKDTSDFVGIGAALETDAKGALIRRVMKGGGAASNGVKVFDIITSIDGVPTAGLALGDIIKKVRGAENTIVRVGIERAGQTIQFAITRQRIVTPNVQVSEMPTLQGTALVVQVAGFMSDNTCEQVTSALTTHAQASGVIVDLRDNGGGRLDVVACMLALFIPPNSVVIEQRDPRTNLPTEKALRVPSTRHLDKRPLVVLINENSASASEIFAGAIQDFRRGILVGNQSYGKGTVQSVTPMPLVRDMDLGSVRGVYFATTVARYHLASGRSPQLLGITPEIFAYAAPVASEFEKISFREGVLFRFPVSSGSSVKAPVNKQLPQVKACVAKSGRAAELYKTEGEYPLQVGRDVLGCMQESRNLALTRDNLSRF